MPNRQTYDIHANWDDPYERQEEKRHTKRFNSSFKFKMAVEVPNHKTPLVGISVAHNISSTGILCSTKHRLYNGQTVRIQIKTGEFATQQGVPKKFNGTAKAIRVNPEKGGKSEVAIAMNQDITGTYEWTQFMDVIESLTALHAS